jgi:hypothetical protein
MSLMEVEESTGSGGLTKPNKRTFLEALREYSQQTAPNAKRASVTATETDIIRVEISKVLKTILTFLKHLRVVL